MLNKILVAQECDAKDDDSSNADDLINKILILEKLKQYK